MIKLYTYKIHTFNFKFTHIFRGRNICAEKLAAFGTSVQGLVWWDLIPTFITEDFFHNRYRIPFFRFKLLLWVKYICLILKFCVR